MTKHKINKQAFTLVELIVVITILAILWTIAFISLQWYSKDARDSVRISDVSNMKTALELFHLDSWKYPLPDDGETVVYSWAIVWTQWDFWTTVLSQLSRSLSEIPTDPVNDKKYIYSVSWNKNQFEILNPLEWDLALNTISQTNAASEARIPKISGEYNGLYVKIGNYIVATPGLITAEAYTTGDDLSNTILSSMVIEWYWNIPSIWNTLSNTWSISWIVLSATWIINKDSTDAEKISVMRTIQNAYTWSDLASWNLYDFILSKTSDEDILALTESIILDNSSSVSSGWSWWWSEPEVPLYVFSTHTFTNCGQTWGVWPNLWQCTTSYSTVWDENTDYLNMTISWIQEWTVPETASYTIITKWGKGVDYSSYLWWNWAIIQWDIDLSKGEIIKILVWQQGASWWWWGTFVTKSDNTPLIIAGWGWGNSAYNYTIVPAEIWTSWWNGSNGFGGTSGGWGSGYDGAPWWAGLTADGGTSSCVHLYQVPLSFINWGVGGTNCAWAWWFWWWSPTDGCCMGQSWPWGWYSGWSAASWSSTYWWWWGSYNSWVNQSNSIWNAWHWSVIITKL